jgi:hypothetical protein
MKLRTHVTIGASAFAVVAAVLSGRVLTGERTQPLTVSQGEVEVRVSGPGARAGDGQRACIRARRCRAADHGERMKRGQLLAVLDDRDLAAKRAAALAARESVARNVRARAQQGAARCGSAPRRLCLAAAGGLRARIDDKFTQACAAWLTRLIR